MANYLLAFSYDNMQKGSMTKQTRTPAINEKLIEFLAPPSRQKQVFAAGVGILKSQLSDLIKGRRPPSLALARRIERYTNKEVSLYSWPE